MNIARPRVFFAICFVTMLSIAVLSLLLYSDQRISTFIRSFRYPEIVAEQHKASTSATDITTELDPSTSSSSTTLELEDIMYKKQEHRKRTLAAECRRLNVLKPNKKSDYSHVLVNDDHRILFHFIPKVSCTTWKKIWRKLYRQHPTGKRVLQLYKREEQNYRLDNYRKVLFVREPMTRLLSAYMSKFRAGVLYNDGVTQRIWEEEFGRDISKRYRGIKVRNRKWLNITLVEFIKYITDPGSDITLDDLTDHWMPQYEVSRPCRIKYDFIGHFENLAVEGPFVLRWLGVDHLVQFPEYRSSNALENFVEYYKLIPLDLMRKLMDYYRVDYRLFGYSPDDVISQVLRGVFADPINLETNS